MTRAAFWRAWSLWAVSVAATAASLIYGALNPLPAALASQEGTGADGVLAVAFIGGFATVGALLAWKRPRNPIGWLLSGTGLAYAIGAVSVLLAHFPRTLGLSNWLSWVWFIGIGLCVYVLLLFPSGTLRSRRWRPVAWAAAVGLAGWTVGNAFAADPISGNPQPPNPVGLAGSAGAVLRAVAGVGALMVVAAGLAAIVSLVVRYRRARSVERAQLKWLIYAVALITVAVLAQIPIERIMGPGDAATNLQNAISSGAVALVPVAIGIAVLRYRLYDIDRVISRTVAYAIITGLLAGVYAGLVLLATEVLRIRTPVAVAAATLAAAALFTPVRRRVQRRVDRRFNRARYDADQTVAAFAARLKEGVDLDTVRGDLASVVQAALEPAHVWVWTSRHD